MYLDLSRGNSVLEFGNEMIIQIQRGNSQYAGDVAKGVPISWEWLQINKEKSWIGGRNVRGNLCLDTKK